MSEKRPGGALKKEKKGETKLQKAGDPFTSTDLLFQAEKVLAARSSKGPAAFFNFAKKFLVKEELCELSAIEGSIVSAVEAATLLERSKLAVIARIQTSYVPIEPKKKKTEPVKVVSEPSYRVDTRKVEAKVKTQGEVSVASEESLPDTAAATAFSPGAGKMPTKALANREMRRARITIMLKRTSEYAQWLLEHPQTSGANVDKEELETLEEEGEEEESATVS